MNAKTLTKLARTQLLALAQTAENEGLTDLRDQFNLFVASLDVSTGEDGTQDDPAETAIPLTAWRPNAVTDAVETEDDEDDYDCGYDDDDHAYDDYYGDYGEEENVEPVIPEGFDSVEQYQEFLAEQGEFSTASVPDEDGEDIDIQVPPEAVVGVVKDEETGEYKDVGNLEESIDTYLRVTDEETGEVHEREQGDDVPTVRVKLARGDEREMSRDDVERIFANPQAAPMIQVFGRDYRVLSTDRDHEKIVSFTVDTTNDTSRMMANAVTSGRALGFGGRIVVNGIGYVTAQIVRGNRA